MSYCNALTLLTTLKVTVFLLNMNDHNDSSFSNILLENIDNNIPLSVDVLTPCKKKIKTQTKNRLFPSKIQQNNYEPNKTRLIRGNKTIHFILRKKNGIKVKLTYTKQV